LTTKLQVGTGNYSCTGLQKPSEGRLRIQCHALVLLNKKALFNMQ